MAQALIPVEIAAKEVLFAKGDPGDAMYIIVKGGVEVFDGEFILSVMHPGQVFGEFSWLDFLYYGGK